MKDKIILVFIALLAVVLYSLTLHGVWGNPGPNDILGKLDQPNKPFELSPERGRYSHVYTLAEDHKYELSKEWATVVYPDVGIYKGKFYAFFAPGISYMAVIFYLVGKAYNLGQVFTFGMISLFSIAGLLCLYKIARNIFKMPLWASLFSVLVFGFSSSAWSYAVTLYQHHVTTFFLLFAFYSTWKFAQRTKWSFMWASFVGLAYGLAISVDYPNAIILFPVMVYFISTLFSLKNEEGIFSVNIRWVGGLALVFFMIITGFQFYHNSLYYGSWKNLAGGIPSYHMSASGDTIQTSVATSTTATTTAADKDVVGFFTETHLPQSFYTLVFSTDRGLFFFCPIFLLALLGLYFARKQFSREYSVLLWVVLVNLFLYSSWGDPWGGWAFGPRYLIPSMSILSLFVGLYISTGSYQLYKRILAFLLVLYGSFIALAGAVTTNSIPTMTEGLLLPAKKYNFLLNIDFIKKGQSGSFLFNNFFSHSVTLLGYFLFIYVFLVIIHIVTLFVLPMFENNNDNG